MTASIRPPGGPPIAPGATGIEGPSEVHADQPVPVGQAGAANRVAPAQTAEVQGPTEALLSRLEAGEVTREQAIEGLVTQALELHGGARLPPAQRSELAGVLRAALLEDPALVRLLG